MHAMPRLLVCTILCTLAVSSLGWMLLRHLCSNWGRVKMIGDTTHPNFMLLSRICPTLSIYLSLSLSLSFSHSPTFPLFLSFTLFLFLCMLPSSLLLYRFHLKNADNDCIISPLPSRLPLLFYELIC